MKERRNRDGPRGLLLACMWNQSRLGHLQRQMRHTPWPPAPGGQPSPAETSQEAASSKSDLQKTNGNFSTNSQRCLYQARAIFSRLMKSLELSTKGLRSLQFAGSASLLVKEQDPLQSKGCLAPALRACDAHSRKRLLERPSRQPGRRGATFVCPSM